MNTILKLVAACFFVISLQSCFGGSSNTPDNEMSFHGVSFKYPSYWQSKTEILEKGYFIKCRERFATGTMLMVSFFEGESEPGKLLINYIDGVCESSPHIKVTTQSTGLVKYGNYDSQIVRYEISALNAKSYGNAYAFNANGKSVLVVEQSERHYDLKHKKFKLIQNSFTVDTPAATK